MSAQAEYRRGAPFTPGQMERYVQSARRERRAVIARAFAAVLAGLHRGALRLFYVPARLSHVSTALAHRGHVERHP